MSEVDYKTRLQKWAQRNKHQISIDTTVDNFPPVDSEHPRYSTCVRCAGINLCTVCASDADESVEQCEQKAARLFLNTYARSPLTIR